MMEIEKRDFNPSWSFTGDKGFPGEVKVKPEASDGFVALDIETLALLVAAASASSPLVDSGEKVLIAGNQTPLKKTLSKKGSQHGGERMTADSVAAAATEWKSLSVMIHVASDGDATALPPEKTPTAAVVGAGGRNRRIAGRRRGPRLDPRRVVVLFASLSSMGTLILLYFTLSIGKMPGGNINSR